MRLLRPKTIIAAFLIITISIPPSMFSQTATKAPQPKYSEPQQRQPGKSQRADALGQAINELLKLHPLAPQSISEKGSENADAQSEERKKPPDDNAPIKELVDFWPQNSDANAAKPSDQVRQRLLEACEDDPELVPALIDLLPETTDTHDRLYKLLQGEQGEIFWKRFLRFWLQSNSRYFRDDLIAEAREEAVNGPMSAYKLRLLSRVDWETARPILEAVASGGNAQMKPVAFSMLYEQAQQDGDSAQAEKYRALLKAIVVNHQALPDGGQVALSSLADAEWSGQEGWVVSLFADPVLSGLKDEAGAGAGGSKAGAEAESEEEAPNILSSLMTRNPERWYPVIINLVGERQRTVHRSAVKLLAEQLNHASLDDKMRKEIVERLAPWLTDPNWAAAEGRSDFIQSLTNAQTPELIPALIWILEHDEAPDNRVAAANALAQYRDQRANPALRRALEKEENESRRYHIVAALAKCGGFSDDEMAEAIEAYAEMAVTEAGKEALDQAASGNAEKPLPLKISIGQVLGGGEAINNNAIQATEGLVIKLIERAKSLRSSRPAVARRMMRVVEGATLRVAEIGLVERIGAGWGDVDALKLALEKRDSLRKSAGAEIYSLIKQGGYAAGIAASILNDEREQRETLAGADTKAQFALLAGARYLRDKLPVELVGNLLNSPNRALPKVAESYLEVEDSAEARKLVMARHRGEAYILGDSLGIDQQASGGWEEAMRKEIKSNNDLEAIYALAPLGAIEDVNGVIIRVRGGKAEISLYEVEGRRDVRMLSQSELEELKSFTSRQEVEDLGPEYYSYYDHSAPQEYLRLTKDGGRRIVLGALRRLPKNPTLHEELSGLFYRLSKSGGFVTRYAIEDKIAGVEVQLADKKQQALVVCGEGREIRVLIGDEGAGYKQDLAEAMSEWREFSSGKLGKTTEAPATCLVSGLIASFMNARWNNPFRWIRQPTHSGGALVYASSSGDPGVWKFEHGAETAKIISGPYSSPVVTPDGKWLAAIKTENDHPQLIRHNLQTGKEFPVTMPDGVYRHPVAYVAARAKVLLGYSGSDGEPEPSAVNYLLDPDTGAVQQVKGEFGPLRSGFTRELQPTGNPNEFWAALPDFKKGATQIGRYDSMNFIFTPLAELPGLILRANNFWVDATSGKIWLTYCGHLLTIPLPAKSK
jgi:HEAT repeat protein